jgi:lipopolysaccharide export system permease protein
MAQPGAAQDGMNILDRYLARAVVSGSLLVLGALLAVQAFIGVLRELDKLGTGNYGMMEALTYVIFSLPKHAHEFIPIAALLGALLGLGGLASSSELVAMRAAGVSVWRLGRGVLLSGLALALVMAVVGDVVAPASESYGQRLRTLSLNAGVSLADGESTWIKDGDRIIHLESQVAGEKFGGVYVFTLDPDHRLTSVARAVSADFTSDGELLLREFRESVIDDRGVSTRAYDGKSQATSLRPELIDLAVLDADKLPSLPLFGYIRYLKRNGLDTYAYEVAFWSRLAELVAAVLMALVALPFVFGPLRSSASGQRVMVGIVIGVVYFVGSKTVLSSGAVFALNPAAIAWLPTLLLAAVVAVGIRSVR